MPQGLQPLMRMKRKLLATILSVLPLAAAAQTYELDWDVSLSGSGSTAGNLPFWAVTGRNGIVPDARNGLLVAGTDFRYASRSDIRVYSGLKLSGSVFSSSSSASSSAWNGMVNELYAGVGWKKLRLDLGMIDREISYGGLSLTGGDIVWSGNTRALPGYNLQVDYFNVPGTKGIFSIKANYADYMFLDRPVCQKRTSAQQIPVLQVPPPPEGASAARPRAMVSVGRGLSGLREAAPVLQ